MDPKTEHATLKRKRRQSSSASPEYGTVCKVSMAPDPSEDDDTEWEVENILDWRQTRDGNGILEYKVLWKGYPKEDASWELKEYLTNAQDVLEDFIKTQRDMPNDLGDEPNGDVLTNGRIIGRGEERPNEDDPHIDWTLYDDDISDEEDIAKPPTSPPHTDPEVVPSTQSVYEARDAAPLNFHTYQISVLYGNFIKVLCARSRNMQAEEHCFEGIPHALNIIRNKRLQEELLADNHSVYGYALIIVVWLIVCLRIHLDERPSHETLTTHCSSLYLTSNRILALTYKVGLADLTVAVKFLEYVLGRQGGGNAWLKHQWFYSIPREVPLKYLPPRNIIAKQYLEALDTDDIPGLADLVLDREVQGPPTSLRRMLKIETVRRWLLGELIKMFATVNPALLRACIEGRIPQLSERLSEDVYQALRLTDSNKTIYPSTYANFICDRAGMAPTPLQWQSVCDQMSLYIEGGGASDRLAARVDQLIYPSKQWPVQMATRGLRRYTEWRHYLKHRRAGISYACRSKVHYFVQQSIERIKFETLADREYAPFMDAVIEVGFGIRADRRLADHQHHRKSNYIMNLAQALFELLFPGMFVLKQCILYNCWRPSQPWLSEIAFTQLSQGYTDTATGFSHYPAGHSNGSSFRKTPMKSWVRFEAEVVNGTALRKRLDEILAGSKRRLKEAREHSLNEEIAANRESAWLQAAITFIQTATKARQADIAYMQLAESLKRSSI